MQAFKDPPPTIKQISTSFASYLCRPEEFLLPGGQGIQIRIHLWKDFTEYEYRIFTMKTFDDPPTP